MPFNSYWMQVWVRRWMNDFIPNASTNLSQAKTYSHTLLSVPGAKWFQQKTYQPLYDLGACTPGCTHRGKRVWGTLITDDLQQTSIEINIIFRVTSLITWYFPPLRVVLEAEQFKKKKKMFCLNLFSGTWGDDCYSCGQNHWQVSAAEESKSWHVQRVVYH